MDREKTFEKVADFEKDNCSFVIYQPTEDPSQEELDSFYMVMGKVLDR